MAVMSSRTVPAASTHCTNRFAKYPISSVSNQYRMVRRMPSNIRSTFDPPTAMTRARRSRSSANRGLFMRYLRDHRLWHRSMKTLPCDATPMKWTGVAKTRRSA